MTLRANGSMGLSLRQSGCSCNLTRAISNAHRSHLFSWFAQPETYIHTCISILPNRVRENPWWRQAATACPAGPVRPCIPVHVHASHIGGRSSSRMQKKVKCGRELETSSGSTHVGRRWSSASLCPSKSCINAYQVSLSEFCDNDDTLCWSEEKESYRGYKYTLLKLMISYLTNSKIKIQLYDYMENNYTINMQLMFGVSS